MEDLRPTITITNIEHLGWVTKKKVVDEEVSVVTKIAFEGQPTGDQMKTLYHLLKGGGPLTVVFTSPQMMMDLGIKEAEEKAKHKEQ